MPLSESLAVVLQSDRTAALAAAVIIGTHHSDVLQWVARTICCATPSENKPRRASRLRARKANGAHKPAPAYATKRRAARDHDDKALVEAMKAAPGATIGEWSQEIGKSRTSTVSALHRLRDAGLADSVEGKWRLTEEPREPPAKWTAPLSGAHRAATAHLTAA